MKHCNFPMLSNKVFGDPGNFGCSFIKEMKTYFPLQTLPRGFCPALLHVIIPYLVTLSNDGWMRWVKKMKDTSKRLNIPQGASKIKNMNRFFYNEVVVQCPDSENGVVVGIGPKNAGKILMVRILDVKKKCPLNITIGNIFEFKPDEQAFCWEAFHRLYPYLLLCDNPRGFPFQDKKGDSVIRCSCNKGKTNFIIQAFNQANNEKNFKEVSDVKCGNYKDLIVSVNSIENKCRYHDSLVTYSENQFAPAGLCPDVFHVAYPFALALLYDADFSNREKKDSVTISCPNINGIKLLVKREKNHSLFLLRIIKFIEKIFEFFFYPIDRIHNDISLTIVSNEGSCPREHKINEKYFLNIQSKKVMCPASFNTLFPQIVQMSYGTKDSEDISSLSHCPDCQGAEYILTYQSR